MAVYEFLSGKAQGYFFNGLLADFLDKDEQFEQYHSFLAEIDGMAEDVRVCADLPVKINHRTISNQIIRYKDSFKLPEGYLRVPLIIYWKREELERAIVLLTTTYIEAKGCYYCMTEPDSAFSECRNDMIAMCLQDSSLADIKKAFAEMDGGTRAVGAIQRYYDHRYLGNVDDMKEKCIELSRQVFDEASARAVETEDRTPIIYDAILRAFLIKKALYVHYMMSKELLSTRHEGDVKKQRQFAKAYTDEIPIVSLSALWRLEKTEE